MEEEYFTASSRGELNKIIFFIDNKYIDVNFIDDKGRSSLHFASASGKTEVVKFLLSRGANPNISDERGNFALHLAATGNHGDIVALLLNAGTNVNAKDGFGKTAIFWAKEHIKYLRTLRSQNTSMQVIYESLEFIVKLISQHMEEQGQNITQMEVIKNKLVNIKAESDIDDLQTMLESLCI